jgi:hypothetical protein
MYNRHQVQGYQTCFINDIYQVEEQLQAYDPHLYIMFNPIEGTWLIMDDITKLAIMKIPQIGFETLDSRLVSHIKKIHTENGFNASWELKESEERREREQERIMSEMTEDYAKEMLPALRELHDTGRIDGVKRYHSGVSG